MGFISQSTFNSVKMTKLGKYLLGKYCYCGYKKKNLNGTFPIMSLPSSAGLENGVKIKFNYKNSSKKLTISNSKNNIYIHNTIAFEEDFYFY